MQCLINLLQTDFPWRSPSLERATLGSRTVRRWRAQEGSEWPVVPSTIFCPFRGGGGHGVCPVIRLHRLCSPALGKRSQQVSALHLSEWDLVSRFERRGWKASQKSLRFRALGEKTAMLKAGARKRNGHKSASVQSKCSVDCSCLLTTPGVLQIRGRDSSVSPPGGLPPLGAVLGSGRVSEAF